MPNTLKLTVFANFTPDSDNGNFYFPNGSSTLGKDFNNKLLTAFKAATQAASDWAEYDATTFKVYDNYIDIGGVLLPSSVWNITYCAVTMNGFPIFYYVDNVQPVSTGLRLYIRIDYWASYIGSASITNVEFFKSNLLLSGTDKNEATIYTTAEQPSRDAVQPVLSPTGIPALSNISIGDLRIYAVIKHHTINYWTTQVEEIHVYKFDPNAYLQLIGITTPPTAEQFISILNYIASINEVGAVGFTGKGAAQVLKLYIFPSNLQTTNVQRQFYGYTTGISNVQFFTASEVKINSYTFDEWIANAPNGLGYTPISTHNPKQLNTIGGEVIFGTQYNGLKLSTIVGESKTQFRVIVNQDQIQFIVYHITSMRDITESFTVGIIANNGELNAQERTAKWLGVIAGVAGGAAQIAAGGVGAISGGIQLANVVNNITESKNGNYIAAGDGLNTFANILYNGGNSFLIYKVPFTPLRSVLDRVLTYGADTHYNMTPAQELRDRLPQCNFILQDPNNRQIPYISAQAKVDNVPYAAATSIADQLLKGVRLVYV